MSEQPKIEAVDFAAREMVAEARRLVGLLRADRIRLHIAETEGREAAGDRYARACFDEIWVRRMPALVAVHDKLAATLNAASPDAPPLLSMTTELPA